MFLPEHGFFMPIVKRKAISEWDVFHKRILHIHSLLNHFKLHVCTTLLFHKQVMRYLFLFGQLQKFINTLCACIQTACPECLITQVNISHRCDILDTGHRCCF